MAQQLQSYLFVTDPLPEVLSVVEREVRCEPDLKHSLF